MPKPEVICVLGMHRSGTSVVARLLNLLGVYLGPEECLVRPGFDNLKGFWEHQQIIDLNDEILKKFGGHHLAAPILPDAWEKSLELDLLKSRARAIISRDFGSSDLWGWKDPRTCLTLPFWQQLLPKMHYIICLRNPIDVAQSLEKRNGLSIEKAAALWLVHVQSALTSTSGQHRMLLFYEDIMEDWQAESRSLVRFLYGKDRAIRYEFPTEMGEFLDVTVRHHCTAMIDAVRDRRIPFPAMSLYALLRAYVSANKNHNGNNKNEEAALMMLLDSFAGRAVTALAQDSLAPHVAQLQADVASGTDAIRQGGEPLDFQEGHPPQKVEGQNSITRTVSKMQSIEENKTVDSEEALWRKEAERLHLILQNQLISESTGLGADYVTMTTSDVAVGNADIKLIAFYLPQFHPIPENDRWWGKGFTEWTQVARAVPQFVGHYQPHLPDEFGFYDLRLVEVQRRQIELARRYGIYGFCYYYYWFDGKRLLERPLEQFLNNADLNFPFCLCWANENWTRRWDGLDSEVLIAQHHSPEDDLEFIKSIESALRDRRYIRINGRPLLIVYRPSLMPDPKGTAQRWRDYCAKAGIGDLYLVVAQAFGTTDPGPSGFDAAVEFPPHKLGDGAPRINSNLVFVNPNYTGVVSEYEYLVRSAKEVSKPEFTLFRTVCPSWDNDPRRPGNGLTYANSAPELYEEWLTYACEYARQEADTEKRIVFVNAWNEWSEGAHLEPDKRYGYAYLQATANALKNSYAANSLEGVEIVFVSHDAARAGAQRSLLTLVRWLRDTSGIRPKIVLRRGGALNEEFHRLGEVFEIEPIVGSGLEDIKSGLLRFCQGSALAYINTLVPGDVAEVLSSLQIPIITHVHEMENAIQRWCTPEHFEALLKITAHFIAASPPVAENLQRRHGVEASRITTIYSFIACSTRDLDPANRGNARREEFPRR